MCFWTASSSSSPKDIDFSHYGTETHLCLYFVTFHISLVSTCLKLIVGWKNSMFLLYVINMLICFKKIICTVNMKLMPVILA